MKLALIILRKILSLITLVIGLYIVISLPIAYRYPDVYLITLTIIIIFFTLFATLDVLLQYFSEGSYTLYDQLWIIVSIVIGILVLSLGHLSSSIVKSPIMKEHVLNLYLLVSLGLGVIYLIYEFDVFWKWFRKAILTNLPLSISLLTLLLIFIGSILFTSPSITTDGESLNVIDAVFTVVSAISVTGLSTIDIGTKLNLLGQTLLMFLIQIGGLGILIIGMLTALLVTGKISTTTSKISEELFGKIGSLGLKEFFIHLIVGVVIFEILGTILLFISFYQVLGLSNDPLYVLFLALFHSISAFNNAGFSIFSSSLQAFYDNIPINLTFMALIIIGGIGFSVWDEILEFIKTKKRLSIHTKLTLRVNLYLWVIGALLFLVFEWWNSLKTLGIGEKILVSVFSSVTSRTAGFSTIDFGSLQEVTLFFFSILMFIGASPGSTGGGIKTTTLGVLLVFAFNVIKGREKNLYAGKVIREDVVGRAITIFLGAFLVVYTATFLVYIFDSSLGFMKIFFEVMSAFGTVGLSTGITSSLSIPSKIILILVMYIGKIGILTFLVSLFRIEKERLEVEFPEEVVLVG